MTAPPPERLDFQQFVAVWNQEQGMGTPALHADICQWLEEQWRQDRRELLLLAFRDSGKSTLVGLFCAWLLYLAPDRRVLVLAADYHLAKKMVRTVKRVVERHPACQGLKPAKPELWGSEEFIIARDRVGRDPSMAAKGVTANFTGSHADIVVCDDVEVPNSANTAGKRAELRQRLAEIAYVLSPGGLLLYIGTPHTFHSIYSHAPCAELGEEVPFLDGFARLEKPVLMADGQSAWPERFPPDAIERIRRRSGPNKFTSQMLLIPVSTEDGRLEPERLQTYEAELQIIQAGGETRFRLQDRALRTLRLWWDPALGTRRRNARKAGDGSVAVLLGEDGRGRFFLHRIRYLAVPAGMEKQAGAVQCGQIADMVADHAIPTVHVEANGIGSFLPETLRGVLAERGLKARVVAEISNRPKAERILSALDAPLYRGDLFIHDSALGTPFLAEMREWRPGGKGHDDGLDAAAGAILACPPQLPENRPARSMVVAAGDFAV